MGGREKLGLIWRELVGRRSHLISESESWAGVWEGEEGRRGSEAGGTRATGTQESFLFVLFVLCSLPFLPPTLLTPASHHLPTPNSPFPSPQSLQSQPFTACKLGHTTLYASQIVTWMPTWHHVLYVKLGTCVQSWVMQKPKLDLTRNISLQTFLH